MSIATIEPPIETGYRIRRWTTAEFDSLLATGHLREGSKTFLWNGEIIEPMPENEPHVYAQDNLQTLLIRLLPAAEWIIRPAHPLALKDGYKPQPDIVVLAGPPADRRRTPTPADVALIVEVADSSYAADAGDKLRQYAAAGIPRYWIVNLAARRIEAYGEPTVASGVGLYAVRIDHALGDAVPLVLTRNGDTREFGVVPVLDVLRDSLEEDA